MTLLQQIDQLWMPAHDDMLASWAALLEERLPAIEAAGQRFREFAPLEVYTSVSRAKAPKVSFSLRYLGQEVADLLVGDDVTVRIDRTRAKTNARYFRVDIVGAFPWRSREGRAFRNSFRNAGRKAVEPRVGEHRIESEFLKEMLRGDRGKFSGMLGGIQPVTLAGCRFQFPLPLSGSTGAPKASRGNIDILARRGTGRGTRLSVWELKAPDASTTPVAQAYIYAATLLKVLRSPSGNFWYQKVLGFSGRVPSRLTVESVVAVSFSDDRKRAAFERKLAAFHRDTPLTVNQDTIRLCAAYYTRPPLRIEFAELG